MLGSSVHLCHRTVVWKPFGISWNGRRSHLAKKCLELTVKDERWNDNDVWAVFFHIFLASWAWIMIYSYVLYIYTYIQISRCLFGRVGAWTSKAATLITCADVLWMFYSISFPLWCWTFLGPRSSQGPSWTNKKPINRWVSWPTPKSRQWLGPLQVWDTEKSHEFQWSIAASGGVRQKGFLDVCRDYSNSLR